MQMKISEFFSCLLYSPDRLAATRCLISKWLWEKALVHNVKNCVWHDDVTVVLCHNGIMSSTDACMKVFFLIRHLWVHVYESLNGVMCTMMALRVHVNCKLIVLSICQYWHHILLLYVFWCSFFGNYTWLYIFI